MVVAILIVIHYFILIVFPCVEHHNNYRVGHRGFSFIYAGEGLKAMPMGRQEEAAALTAVHGSWGVSLQGSGSIGSLLFPGNSRGLRSGF